MAEQALADTPLSAAQNEARHLRRKLICDYEQQHDCRLLVMIDLIHPDGVTFLSDLLQHPDRSRDLHLMLRSEGGEAEVAVRLARLVQAACARFVVVVPDIAKSAATIFALGADEIVMAPPSDLGPIDPQLIMSERGYVSAKEVIAEVDDALNDVHDRPRTSSLRTALLETGNVDATIYQFAKSALSQIGEVARQALAANPRRSPEQVDALTASVAERLVTDPHAHSAVVGAAEARAVGLPVRELALDSDWWREIWALWTRYFALGVNDKMIYECATGSQVSQRPADPAERPEPDRDRDRERERERR